MKIAAMDYGASNGRMMLCDYSDGKLSLKEMHRFPNAPVYMGGELFWDFLNLLSQLKEGLKKASREGEIASLGIDTWGVDFGLLDADGRLMQMPYCYRGPHTEGMTEAVFSAVPRREVFDRTGVQIMRINTLYQLYGIKERRPALLDRAKRLVMISDLLLYYVSGALMTEYSMVSTSQIYNPVKKDWDRELIRKLGLPDGIFSKVTHSGQIAGQLDKYTAKETGVQCKVVSVASHDTGSAVLAVPAVKGGNSMYISSGTWSLVGVESPVPVINDTIYNLNFSNEGAFDGGIRLLKNVMGLWILQQLKGEWDEAGNSMNWNQIVEKAKAEEPFKFMIDPDDDSFIEPGAMTPRIDAYCKKTRQACPDGIGAYARTVFESLAMKYKYCHEGLKQITGKPIDTIHIIGGGCQNELLNQFTADATGATVLAGPSEATAAGNALAQLIAMGELSGTEEARQVVRQSFDCKAYEPAGTGRWNDAYGRFLRICGLE
jgi:rhamnulokinase